MDLPSWIDEEAWNGFDDMRKARKKPLTPRAMKLIVTELEKLRERGHDVNAALDQSTMHCWLDVYPVKDKEVPNLIRTQTAREAPMTQAERDASEAARLLVLEKIRPSFKLVKAA